MSELRFEKLEDELLVLFKFNEDLELKNAKTMFKFEQFTIDANPKSSL